LSDTERLEPIGDQEDGVLDPMDADEIRAEIDEARAATERYRAKAESSLRTHGPG
jgi:hypothetical protein